jgi:hypothetical protein
MPRFLTLSLLLPLFSACVSWETPDIDGDGVLASDGDCDDLNADANPGSDEVWYDGVDQNCDGNDGDKDGDGFDSWQVGGQDCWDDPDSPPAGFLVVSSDFEQPTAENVNPDGSETWYDGVDGNCDSEDDFDQDGDGFRTRFHADETGAIGDDCIDGSPLDDPNDANLAPADVNPDVTDDICYDGTNADCDTDEADILNPNTDYLSDYDCDGDGWMLEEECDDTNPAIEPNDDPDPFGDCVDANCDGNDGDEDGDGYVTDAYTTACPDWASLKSHIGDGDCWDSGTASTDFTPINGFASTTAAEVNPDAATVEIFYDAIDQNCDGASDFDADLDGYDTSSYTDRTGQSGLDCNDDKDAVHPGAMEDCSTTYDDNCDDDTNDLNASSCTSYWQDFDADAYGDEGTQARCYCEPKVNVSANEYYRATNDDDCNDNDYYANPGVKEYCDGHDDDCDGSVDEDDAEDAITYYADSDSDDYGDASSTTAACSVPSGYVTNDDDCDDSNSNAYPGNDEVCDGADNDCEGDVDEDDATDVLTWYADKDNDNYGDPATSDIDCNQPTAYVADNTDCRPTDSTAYPGADEYCDGHDDDCDNDIDENDSVDASTWYVDSDTDGYGEINTTKTQCYQPSGYVSSSTDCDDTDNNINPAGTEICDSNDDDEDCDGGADDADPNGTPSSGTTDYYTDSDSDNYGSDSASATAYCDDPGTGAVTNNTDCDDNDNSINPDGTEICDSSNDDEDCDGGADDNDPEGPSSGGTLYYIDDDIDGYGSDSSTGLRVCDSAPSNYVNDDSDCDDTDTDINPGEQEIACDNTDSNCDGNDSEYGINDLSAGDLILTEIMNNPQAVSDSKGEWFEIYNAGSLTYDLDGLDLTSSGSGSQSDAVDTCLAIAPGEYKVFVFNSNSNNNGGVTGDFDYNSIGLSNGSDTLSLVAGSTTIDEVSWDNGSTFPDPNGESISLHPANTDPTENDIGTTWCEATSTFGDGDKGTPGAVNDNCGESIDTNVQALLTANCTSCHSGSSPSKSLDLASGNAWDATYLVSSIQSSSDYLVDPADSSNSWLAIKIEGTQGSGNGVQMPKGTSALSNTDIQTITDWIDDGAWK